MTTAEAAEKLADLEANQFEALYRSRWDSKHAASVVPLLVSCLGVDDTKLLHRALLALFRIGPAAHSAADAVIGLMFHSDTLICEVATHTLGGVCIHYPERAIKPLKQVASDPRLQKAALFSLIGLGRGAAPALAVFVTSFESKDARIRRLAVRGGWPRVGPVIPFAVLSCPERSRIAMARFVPPLSGWHEPSMRTNRPGMRKSPNKIGADNRAPGLQFHGFGFFIDLVARNAAITGSVSDLARSAPWHI